MPIHLRAELGDYAPYVLCPGDPRRAKHIAETFFDEGFRCVNEERGLLGFTGTFDGKPLSVQSTGMGAPSAGIVFEELAMLGVKRLVRVGTAGGLLPELRMADLLIASSASADDRTPLAYAGMEGFAPTATFALVERAAQLVRGDTSRVFVGPVVSSGLFYGHDPSVARRWAKLGHLGVEMEAAMLYAVAAKKGLEALALMTVSDLKVSDDGAFERIGDEDLARGVDRMMRVACRVAVG